MAENANPVTSVSKDFCDERHKALAEYVGNDKTRLEKHDCEIKDVQEAIVRLTALLEKHTETDEDHEMRIRSIEAMPAKRWDSAITQIITLLIAAGFGAAIANLV
ncbi:hypothetical protein LPY66_16010 [Dehalobacter sp. DCM]|uniref:hypothetical protein n=1 Tax=Dehalobacter sp. DCM TaxID=2907827 RepID=UPI0030821715|nr:hypothetical protein LPY66_16010 [Dehalobacter sp. DCM]